jgi:uncharacterized membrane protein
MDIDEHELESEHESKGGHESDVGPIVGSLIIVIVLLIAAVYYWEQHVNTVEEQNIAAQKSALELQQENAREGIIVVSSSTKISDIEKDLNSIGSK